jgi:hypothetical protein
MADPERAGLFREAFAAIRGGDFDAIFRSLQALGYTLRQTGDANHYFYFHSMLKDDKHFAFPRNLYRPHGKHRDTGKVSSRDRSMARQSVEALQALLDSRDKEEEGGYDRLDS